MNRLLAPCIMVVASCALVPGFDNGADGVGQGVVSHQCFFPWDCSPDGLDTCVATSSGNRCMALSEDFTTASPVAQSVMQALAHAQNAPQTVTRIVGGPLPATTGATVQAYSALAETILGGLVAGERQRLIEAQQFITTDSRAADTESQAYKYESYRKLYAAKYEQNQQIKVALTRLFNFMASKPFLTRYTDGSIALEALRQCGQTLRRHPLDGTIDTSNAAVVACLNEIEPLAVLMQDAMKLSQVSLWPGNYVQLLVQERGLVERAMSLGLSGMAEGDVSRMAALRHRIESLFGSLETDYIVLIQMLDETLRSLALVEMPISISPINPNVPPVGNEDAPVRTYALGQWANGDWWRFEQTVPLSGEPEPIPAELWRIYFEGAFRQAITIAGEINQSLEQKLAQGGFADQEAWKLVPLMDATGLLHLPEYAHLGPIHEQLRAQVQYEQDVAKRDMWKDLSLCGLGIVGGAAIGSLVGAAGAGARVGGTVLCSIGAYHGLKEAQALAQILSAYHTMAFFGVDSGYASLIRIDDLTEQYKWSLFFVGADVIGATFDVTDISRGVPELIEATAQAMPRIGARMAQSWEASWLRYILTTGQIPLAPDAIQHLPDGTAVVRLAAEGAGPVRLLRHASGEDILKTVSDIRHQAEAISQSNAEQIANINQQVEQLRANLEQLAQTYGASDVVRTPQKYSEVWRDRPAAVLAAWMGAFREAADLLAGSSGRFSSYTLKRFAGLYRLDAVLLPSTSNFLERLRAELSAINNITIASGTSSQKLVSVLKRENSAYLSRLEQMARQVSALIWFELVPNAVYDSTGRLLPLEDRIARMGDILGRIERARTSEAALPLLLRETIDDPFDIVGKAMGNFSSLLVDNAFAVFEEASRWNNHPSFVLPTVLAYIATLGDWEATAILIRQDDSEIAEVLALKATEIARLYEEATPKDATNVIAPIFRERSRLYAAMASALGG